MKAAGEILSISDLPGLSRLKDFDNQFLMRMISERISLIGERPLEKYIEFLGENAAERQALIDQLYVSYSAFFRNPVTHATLGRIILPAMVMNQKKNPRQEIRIWSTAAAAGQEVYSLAMMLEDLSVNIANPVNYRIFASDISEKMLETARTGIYDSEMVGNIPFRFLRRWFSQQGDHYQVDPRLKERITFIHFDLLDSSRYCPPECIFGEFDIVICANVLFYYQPEIRISILKRIMRCMKQGGLLMTGEVERDGIPSRYFTEIYSPSAIFIKKATHEKS